MTKTKVIHFRRTDTLIVTGRIGIVDAVLVRYLAAAKGEAGRMLLHVSGSIYDGIIPKNHIEEFIGSLSIVDGVLKEAEVKREAQRAGVTIISIPEDEMEKYTLYCILKTDGTTRNNLKATEAGKLVDIREMADRYGCTPGERKISVAMVSGSFDLIHAGHVRYINAARELADIVIVATMSTDSIKQQAKNVGGYRPVYSQEDRILVLSYLKYVDHIVIFPTLNCKEVIKAIRPDYFVKSERDMSRQIVQEECALAHDSGSKIITARDYAGYSSTDIINYIRNRYSKGNEHVFFDI